MRPFNIMPQSRGVQSKVVSTNDRNDRDEAPGEQS
jgi:hypothetical protein